MCVCVSERERERDPMGCSPPGSSMEFSMQEYRDVLRDRERKGAARPCGSHAPSAEFTFANSVAVWPALPQLFSAERSTGASGFRRADSSGQARGSSVFVRPPPGTPVPDPPTEGVPGRGTAGLDVSPGFRAPHCGALWRPKPARSRGWSHDRQG